MRAPRPRCLAHRLAHRFAALGIATLVGACAITPLPRARADLPLPASAPPSTAAVAGKVEVVAPRGRLNQAERRALLERVGDQGSETLVKRQLANMARFGGVDLYAGNDADLLIDGPATFAAMFKAIEAARHSILLESYIVEHDRVAQDFAALLKRKRDQGVKVALIYDAVGSIGTDNDYFEGLRAAGIAVCAFNPVNPLKAGGRPGYWDISHRDHRKILVVDRVVGFVGGINISAVYSSGSFGGKRAAKPPERAKEDGWRDTQIQLRGTAAPVLDDLVRETWQTQRCRDPLPEVTPVKPAKLAAGAQLVRIVPSTPDDAASPIYAMLLTAIDGAQRSVYLTMAYFAPGSDMVDALCDAARRGVDVQLILPSISDFKPVLHAGRSYYAQLLDAGVKLHELQDAVLHAKTAVIDGVVSTVGSSNLDWRSFTGNNEVNAVVIGEAFGDSMERMFRQDLSASRQITREAWRDRSVWQRLRELSARLFERLW